MYEQLFSLEGKTIIVTGASSGLGRELAATYAMAGANIVAASRTLSKLEEVVREIEVKGGKALAVRTDVTNNDDVEHLLKASLEHFGGVDVLLNNAGISLPGLLAEQVTEDQMQTIMDTNFKGIFLCGTVVARYMIGQNRGKIINMSSVLGQTTWAQGSIYCVSKAAVNQLTKTWAIEWASKNVTVNALAPTFITTDMNRDLLAQERFRRSVLSHLPWEGSVRVRI